MHLSITTAHTWETFVESIFMHFSNWIMHYEGQEYEDWVRVCDLRIHMGKLILSVLMELLGSKYCAEMGFRGINDFPCICQIMHTMDKCSVWPSFWEPVLMHSRLFLSFIPFVQSDFLWVLLGVWVLWRQDRLIMWSIILMIIVTITVVWRFQ